MPIEMIEELDQGTQIKVIGAGGGGGYAVEHMLGEGVQGVTAGEDVHLVAGELHQVTSMQSRIRIRPSRILVLTVLRATPSSCATCG